MQLYYNRYMIVFDASTLILLAKTDLLNLFIEDFNGKIAIPKKVRAEACVEGREERPLIESLINKGKIEVLTVRNPKQKIGLMQDFAIDEGEAETLLLAIQTEAKCIATDDRNAIRASKLLKIDFVSAIGFLLSAFERKRIDRNEALIKLQSLKRIARYSNAIIEDAKSKIKGELNNGG